jgi:hypothetical protein
MAGAEFRAPAFLAHGEPIFPLVPVRIERELIVEVALPRGIRESAFFPLSTMNRPSGGANATGRSVRCPAIAAWSSLIHWFGPGSSARDAQVIDSTRAAARMVWVNRMENSPQAKTNSKAVPRRQPWRAAP